MHCAGVQNNFADSTNPHGRLLIMGSSDLCPIECRICETPVLDNGVQMSGVDQDKFRRWWKNSLEDGKLANELDDVSLSSSWICQFCLCNARQEREEPGLDWWSAIQDENQSFFEEFDFIEEEISPGEVIIKKIKREVLQVVPSAIPVSIPVPEKLIQLSKHIACVYCGNIFVTAHGLSIHVRITHSQIETFCCHICNIYFASRDDKAKHDLDLHSSPLMHCHFCAKIVSSKIDLKTHISEMHHDQGNKCCGIFFKTVDFLVNHMNWRQPKVNMICSKGKDQQIKVTVTHESQPGLVQCLYCPCKILPSHLDAHVGMMHSSLKIMCLKPHCRTYFLTWKDHNAHMDSKHSSEKILQPPRIAVNYCCSFPGCKKQFASQADVKIHAVTHTLRKIIVVSPQKKDAPPGRIPSLKKPKPVNSEPAGLVEKSTVAHKKPSDVLHCDTRGLKNMKYDIMKRHKELHKAQMDCKKCSIVFKSSDCQEVHMCKSNDSQVYCSVCQSYVDDLRDHRRAPPCHFCKWPMPCQNNLQLHLKTCSKRAKNQNIFTIPFRENM